MNHIRLPAEWEAQSGVMLTWPHKFNDWAAQLAQVEQVFINIAREISLRERVLIVCYDEEHQQHITACLQQAQARLEQLRFAIAPSNDVWARDHGPISVYQDDSLTLLDFIFNGWDNKFPASLDNQINLKLAAQHSWGAHPLKPIKLVLEGGGIEADGQGSLMITASCLLESQRNPNLDQAQMEKQLSQYLGSERFLWLHHGHLAGDDTDGHIDTLARFCDAGTIAYVACDDPQDEHYDALQQMKLELEAFRTANGQPYRLVPLPMPAAKYDEALQRLPATYANFLIINGAVLVPTYDDAQDENALQAIQGCFSDREIVGIDCLALIQQYGSLHCVSMQLPAGILN